ncbi:MAG TPA: class I SAM-dependent methyltransferase [Syntrophorhabdaceae bacterium]|nr:class I SAM-dependent methyltransferase [Syntrophorhabdaceae bacterium]
MIDIQTIDWNEVWKAKKATRPYPTRDSASWDKRAPSFAEHVAKTAYAEAFLKIVNPKRNWTIFDMACGAGTLAIPFAKRVKAITAVDFSEAMIRILREQCHRSAISNIRTINASWADDWGRAGIGLHDVAIASRSLVVDDLRSAILKLSSMAKRRVYISTIVDDGPHDRRVFEAIGRELNIGPDYIYTYNLLYQMGVRANIDFITERNHKAYKRRHQVVESMKWMLGDMTPEEAEKLNEYLDKHLVYDAGWWMLNYEKPITWAVIWWNKDSHS